MKNDCQVEVTPWHHWIADYSSIQRMPLIPCESQLFTLKLKKRPDWIANWKPQFLLKWPVLMDICCKLGVLEFSF
jgi:hypothetical protein